VSLHVLERNAKAIALYKKWGFEVTETKFVYYVGQAVLKMVKQLQRMSPNGDCPNDKDVSCAKHAGFNVRPLEEQDMRLIYQYDVDMCKELSSTNTKAAPIPPLGQSFLDRVCAPSRRSFHHWRTLVLDFAGAPCGFLIFSYEKPKLFRFGKKSYVKLRFFRIAVDQRDKGLSHVLLSGLFCVWVFDV
jgi:hypothetical protein